MLPHINSMIDTPSVPYQQHQQRVYLQPRNHHGQPPSPPPAQQLHFTHQHLHQTPVPQQVPTVRQMKNEHDRRNTVRPGGDSERRRKRSKYVAMACFECKRRKVKCNGQNKCERCTKMSLECAYRDPEEYTQRKIVWNDMQPANSHGQLTKLVQTGENSPSSTHQNSGSVGYTVSNKNRTPNAIDKSTPSSSPGSLLPPQNLVATSSAYAPGLPMMARFTLPPQPPQPLKHVADQQISSVSTPSDRSSRSTSVCYGSLSTLSPAASDVNNSNHRIATLTKPARAWGKDESKSFRGPTSSCFPFQQATRILDSESVNQGGVGYKESDEDDDEELSEESEVEVKDDGAKAKRKSSMSTNKKFLYIDYLEAKKLIQVYESEINCMYPIFEVQELDAKYEDFRQYYEQHGVNLPNMQDLSIIKIILAIATSVTETHVAEGRKLYEEVLKMTERNIVAGSADIYTLISLWLIHNYQFHAGLESRAYRTICFAAVLAIELGLHQSTKMSQMFPDPMQRERCRALFWCVYVADRRLAFSTGRPYMLRDEDLDQARPQVHKSEEAILDDKRIRALYLNAMIQYSQVVGRVWRAVNSFNPPRHFTINTEEIDYIEFLIHRWHQSLPPELRLHSATDRGQYPSPPQLSRKLQTILYLRHNLMFLHLYRPIMFSTRTIAEHMSLALRAVEIALDSIRELSRLHFETDLYASCQIHYNYFLVSALGVIFTAIIHAPAVFAAPCKREFNMALDLIKLFSKVSRVGRRLWATVRKLRSVTAAYGIGTSAAVKSPTSISTEDAGSQVRRNCEPAEVSLHSNTSVTPPVSTGQSVDYELEVDGSSVGQHIMLTGITPPSEAPTPATVVDDVIEGVTGKQQSQYQPQQPIQDQGYQYGHRDHVSPLAVSATASSIDGQNLSTEISELFNFMTGDSQTATVTAYSVPSVPITSTHASMTREPQIPMKQAQISGGYTPLGLEAAQVAQMLAQSGRGDSTWDDELFRLIDNLF
ncbi:fungal-specific transcription factor domain-containing protein [Lipomyces chichibuensis]|uniref:fungal-specific transcription factor domain-containing protein n=1 Tax=Lipomyces chichibuensis TaxID=1546026 RepID=UPI003343C7B1